MQLDQKINKQTSRRTRSYYPLCVIILPLILPAQSLFHHHLLPSFVEPTTFSLENCLLLQDSNAMQDLFTHPSNIIHHSIHHITITCQQLANNLPMANLFTRLLCLFRQSNLHHHHLCIQWYTWFHILICVKLM